MTLRRDDADRPICTRRFTAEVRGKRKFATATLWSPQKRGRDWACKLFISNIGMKEPILAYGVDRMQAVILALEGVLVMLKKSGVPWRWVHGEAGDTGIPRFVPGGFGREFAARLESIIDAETERFATLAEQRHVAKVARPRSKARKSRE